MQPVDCPVPAATPASLQRFVSAQVADYERALGELATGRKRSHWMWYVLPQLRGLGSSALAHKYGLADAHEAMAYAAHPLLGPRLVACVQQVLALAGTDPVAIFGAVDAMKFQSCLTLFAAVCPQQPVFAQALQAFYQGRADAKTLALLKTMTP